MSDLDMDLDMDLDIDLDELEGIPEAEVIDTSDEDSSVVDLFDGKFDISFYGLIPNTILKEDDDVLEMLILISSEMPESREKIINLLKDMDIFIKHMEIMLNSSNIPTEVNFNVANDIYNKFFKKMQVIKEAAKELADTNLQEQSEQVADFFKKPATLTEAAKVDGVITYLISSDKYDATPANSLAIQLAKRYKSVIFNSSKVNDIVDKYTQLETILKTSTLNENKSPVVETLVKLSKYHLRSYLFNPEEKTAMGYLGFPHICEGYESYYKSSPMTVLAAKAEGLKKSKSKVQETYKQYQERKLDTLRNNYITFARKQYVCEENQMAGVTSSCFYF